MKVKTYVWGIHGTSALNLQHLEINTNILPALTCCSLSSHSGRAKNILNKGTGVDRALKTPKCIAGSGHSDLMAKRIPGRDKHWLGRTNWSFSSVVSGCLGDEVHT